MFTWIWVFVLYSWNIETLFQKLEDQKLETMQLVGHGFSIEYR